MVPTLNFFVMFIVSFLTAFLFVYPIKKLAIIFGIMDIPNERKVHKKPIPRIGGLAIALGTFLGLAYIRPNHDYFFEYVLGSIIIILTGFLDDKFTLRPTVKLSGQFIATLILLVSGLLIEKITLPFVGVVELSPPFSIVLTLIWVIGITNAINLIDGLDGLASGVSTIALISIFIMALMDMRLFVAYLCIALIGSNIGFLFHNFYPAKIYMGDTGSLFLGFSISVLSILGLFKKITLFSFIIPIIVLAVPIFDTLFAIIRRVLNGEKIMKPDKKHFHHQLLVAGFSHRATVLIIYGISVVFGLLAIIFSNASIGYLLITTLIWIFLLYVIAEIVGVVGNSKQPIFSLVKKWLKSVNKTSDDNF